MIDLSPIEVEATKEHQWTIVWLHGLGADGHDFVPVAKAMGLESVRYVFPNAPIAPVTLNHGMKMRSWYDIKSLEVVPTASLTKTSFAQLKHCKNSLQPKGSAWEAPTGYSSLDLVRAVL